MRFWGQLFLWHLKETHQNTTFLNVHLMKPHQSGSPATPGLGWAAAAWHCPAQDGWKQSQLHQGLNNLLLSLCKHPPHFKWAGLAIADTPRSGRAAGKEQGRGKELMRAGVPSTLPAAAPPTHQAQQRGHPSSSSQMRNQPFPPWWEILDYEILDNEILDYTNLSPQVTRFAQVVFVSPRYYG